MSLKITVDQMKDLLHNITLDLLKATTGNKAASQRVRTSTVRFEKVAKKYRKESVAVEKKVAPKKKVAKAPARKVVKAAPKKAKKRR